jgi:hypothetical protein
MMLQQGGSIVASEPIGNAKYALASCEQRTCNAAGAAMHAFKLVHSGLLPLRPSQLLQPLTIGYKHSLNEVR